MHACALDILGIAQGAITNVGQEPPGGGIDKKQALSTAFNVASEVLSRGLEYKEGKEAAAVAAKTGAADLRRVVDADQRVKDAVYTARVSEEFKRPTAEADKAAAAQAILAQEIAAEGLSPENQKKRAAAAKAALDRAVAEWQKAAAGANKGAARAKQIMVEVADAIYGKTQYQRITANPGEGQSAAAGPSWWTRPVVGPVPGWGVAVGSAGIAAAVGTILWKILGRK